MMVTLAVVTTLLNDRSSQEVQLVVRLELKAGPPEQNSDRRGGKRMVD